MRKNMPRRILFVCWGNICRSPMAEAVFRELARRSGRESGFEVASAGVSREEEGNPIYPPVRRLLSKHGIPFSSHAARRMDRSDYDAFNLLVAMDNLSLRRMREICMGDPLDKCRLLMDYTDRPREVADPWYTGDFEAAWRDVLDGCGGLLTAELNHLAESEP